MPALIQIHDDLAAALAAVTHDGKDLSLMLGNGFGCSYDRKAFDWGNICKRTKTNYKKKTFGHLDLTELLDSKLQTTNLEDAIAWIEHSLEILDIARANGVCKVAFSLRDSLQALEQSFVEAIVELQPSSGKAVDDLDKAVCGKFLGKFKNIFTVNYDLLLYWVILYQNRPPKTKKWFDAFSKTGTLSASLASVSANRWAGPTNSYQNIFYLHGAVHLFCDAVEELWKLKFDGVNILDVVSKLMTSYPPMHPLFVAGGEWKNKLAKVNVSAYLDYCLGALGVLPKTLVTFGWSIQDRDLHLIDRLVQGSCKCLIVGVRGNTATAKLKGAEIYARVAGRERLLTGANALDICFYNSNSVSIWDPSNPSGRTR